MFVCKLHIQFTKFVGVHFSVIGWHFHADQKHLALGTSRPRDDRVKIGLGVCQRVAAQTVVGPEFDNHDCRVMPLQRLGNTALATGGGLAANAGIDRGVTGFRTIELMLQQSYPPLVYGDAVSG